MSFFSWKTNVSNREIHHHASPKDLAAVAVIRKLSLPFKGAMSSPAARRAYDAMIEAIPMATDVAYEASSVGGIAGVWCLPKAAQSRAAILYLHGGGYMVGSAHAYRHFAGQFAARVGVATFVPDYRLAPEHPFPAAVHDAQAAYRGILAQGFETVALVGDSAGGGISLITLALAHADAAVGNRANPACCVAISPWVDLALTGSSLISKAEEDPFLTREALKIFADAYLGMQDARQPTASPLYGQPRNLAPTQIHVGTSEVLLDDSLRYAERAQPEGDLAVHVWHGMPHVFPSSIGILDAAEESMQIMTAFLVKHLRDRLDRTT
jgi:epsilon-lactone hydrolase